MIEWSQMRILVIEENVPRRRQICAILRGLGLDKIMECADGLEGLVIIDSSVTRIHAVICEWTMPHMTAAMLADALRVRGLKTAIILLTNGHDFAGMVLARESGIGTYIQTPFNPAQVQHKLRQIAST